MRLVAVGGLAVIAALSGCSPSPLGTGEGGDGPRPSLSPTVALPTERPEVGQLCGIKVSSSVKQPEVAPLALFFCGSVPEWLAAAEAAGTQPTVDSLLESCKGQDSAPVCTDAIDRKLVTATGNGQVARLEATAAWCGQTESVADEGASLTFTSTGSGLTHEPSCVLENLQAPSYVIEHVVSTRALDGQQTDEWDDLEARWTFHPDSGLRMTIVDRARS